VAARDITHEASELLTGALRKIAIVSFHARGLGRVLEDVTPYEIALQAHFEGLLYAGVSAEEKLTIALGHLSGIDSGGDTKLLGRRLRDRPELADLGRPILDWVGQREDNKTLADEARTLRNAATHRFYDKTGGPHGEWHYQVEVRPGHFADGMLLEFAEAYARHVGGLGAIIDTVAGRWELRLEPAPVEA
jgi:hypothetical protein